MHTQETQAVKPTFKQKDLVVAQHRVHRAIYAEFVFSAMLSFDYVRAHMECDFATPTSSLTQLMLGACHLPNL